MKRPPVGEPAYNYPTGVMVKLDEEARALKLTVLVMGGFQMIMMGVLGEYIWRTLDEVRCRPRYMVDEDLNRPE